MRAVRLRRVLFDPLGIRQWGVGRCVGATYRRQHDDGGWTLHCGVPSGRTHIRWECRDVIFVDTAAEEWLPAKWRRAMRRYCLAWPSSAVDVAALAALTDADIAKVIREYAILVGNESPPNDNHARLVGHTIGAFARFYPLYRDEDRSE